LTFVVDASAVAPFFLPDERGELADELLSRMAAGEHCVVPTLFISEITNLLVSAVRRRRLAVADAVVLLAALAEWPIDIDTRGDRAGRVFALAVRHGLSAYDATYLDLAIDAGAELATHDRALALAARAEGLELVAPPA